MECFKEEIPIQISITPEHIISKIIDTSVQWTWTWTLDTACKNYKQANVFKQNEIYMLPGNTYCYR